MSTVDCVKTFLRLLFLYKALKVSHVCDPDPSRFKISELPYCNDYMHDESILLLSEQNFLDVFLKELKKSWKNSDILTE